MIKLESLPSQQERKNAGLARILRQWRYVLYIIPVATAIVAAWTYFAYPPVPGGSATIIQSNDGMDLGYAVFVTSRLAITDIEVPRQVRLITGSSTVDANKVRSEHLPENLTLSLLAADKDATEDVATSGAPDLSEPVSVSGTDVNWHGLLKPRSGSPYLAMESAPELSGAHAVRQRGLLVGIAVPVKAETIIIPISRIRSTFAELASQ